jgi:hypothetical protein
MTEQLKKAAGIFWNVPKTGKKTESGKTVAIPEVFSLWFFFSLCFHFLLKKLIFPIKKKLNFLTSNNLQL